MKMDVYCIPPSAHLELMHLGDRFFCLAQLYEKSEEYREFFKERVAKEDWVTLDNGVGDYDEISQKELLDITQDLMPSEVIPLDVLFDGRQTYENTVNFIDELRNRSLDTQVAILSCPQGETLNEWISCYEQFLDLDEVKTIGMSKIAIPYVISGSRNDRNIGRDRNKMFDLLKEKSLLKKQLHFLGAGTPLEFSHYKNCELARSTDSCFSIFSAMNGYDWTKDEFIRRETPKRYFDMKMTDDQCSLARTNVAWFKGFLTNY